jgi:dTDP-4-amino-4,6-dideoxygalactose transaminase
MRDRKEGIFPVWPLWDGDDLEAVSSVIRSGNWWCGSPVDRAGKNVWDFQEEFARFQEARHCIAVSNGTVALETVLLALDVGMGDEVIVSDYTFVASASAIVAVNAVPIFCDINPKTLVMDIDKVEPLITPRTKAIIAVHLGGNPVEMDRLCRLASEHNLYIIEDCAHAHGSRFKGKRLGNWGVAGTFSFQASKVLNSGEGGAIVCNDARLADRIYSISDCGRLKGDYFYAHFHFGTNYRMPELLAALLRSQLKKFPHQHRLRNENARYLYQRLNGIAGISVMEPTEGTEELGYYIYPFLFDPVQFRGIKKHEFEKRLNEAGIPTDDCYPPLHTLECFREVRLRKGIDYSMANWGGSRSSDSDFPVAAFVYSHSVQLPHYVLLAEKDKLDYIARIIEGMR